MNHPSQRLRMKVGGLALTLMLAFAARAVVAAQDDETNQHFLHDLGGPFIVYRGRIQTELKLTDVQKDKLRQVEAGYVQDSKQLEESLQSTQPEDRDEAMKPLREKSASKFWPYLKEVLDDDQLKRLHELELQHEGPAAIFRPEIAQTLQITDEERQKIVGVIQDLQQTIIPLMKSAQTGGNPQEIRPKVIKLIEDHELTVESMLDPTQLKLWLEMRGKPFDTLSP